LLGGAAYAIDVDFSIEVDPSKVLRRISCSASSLSISGPGCCTFPILSEQFFLHIFRLVDGGFCVCAFLFCVELCAFGAIFLIGMAYYVHCGVLTVNTQISFADLWE
jgi:hypothetical protein